MPLEQHVKNEIIHAIIDADGGAVDAFKLPCGIIVDVEYSYEQESILLRHETRFDEAEYDVIHHYDVKWVLLYVEGQTEYFYEFSAAEIEELEKNLEEP